MASCGKFLHFFKQNKCTFQVHLKLCSTLESSKSIKPCLKDIVIPTYIERGPTDILKALASTTGKDYTAPHLKYEDDPYFIPSSNVSKRSFALSKESGRKAARYFLEKYPEFFMCNTSVPHIQAFDPPTVFTEENSSLESLKQCISENDLNSANTVYSILKQKGIEVPQALKQNLLELMCFYNSKQPPSEDYFEERYFSRFDDQERWNSRGMAEVLFEEIEKDGRTYSAMIAGRAKYLNADQAWILYDEMKEKGLQCSLEAYNNLISVIHLLKEDHGTRWEFALRLMATMESEGINPDVYTFNAVLHVLLHCSRWRKAMVHARSIMSEMKRLRIEPTLGSYYYLMSIFCQNEMSNSSILYEIMKEIEGKELCATHPADVSFFMTAMEICFRGLKDKNLAYSIHKLVENASNCKLLGNSFSESIYFKHFFKVLSQTEEIDVFMEVYDKYVPNTYTPEPSVMMSIIEAIHFTGNYQHLPRMCSDVLLFSQTERENILHLLLEAASSMKHETKLQTDIVNTVWNILKRLNERSEIGRLAFDWTSVILGNFLTTFINGRDMEKSWSVVEKLKAQEMRIIGYPEKKILLNFCEFCLEEGHYDKAAFCVRYAVNSAYPDFREDVEKLVSSMNEQQKLSEEKRQKIATELKLFSQSSDTSQSSDSSSSSDESGESSSDDEEDFDKSKKDL